ncbi:MAG: hypothetical protein K9G13_00015 [Aquiluna sp.]|nr:hypothetical protein [Aquiluna sp.]MCF8544921.1 hypothetical protein [Aquiluna sp.]
MEQRRSRPEPKREGPSGRSERNESERPEWQKRVARERTDEKSPLIPSEITPDDVDMGVRVQLKTLTAENAEMTARHLAMVSLLINDDPELAHKHAIAAARRAGRLAIAHETLGITAYAIGDFTLALRELLTHRRLSGSNDQLPLIVDAERGMGRPERALEAVAGVDRNSLPVGIRINLAIALSGARLDLGNAKLAQQELEIAELSPKRVFEQSPLLFRSYAEVLREQGKNGDEWEQLAAKADKALASHGEELFELFEEIEIPTTEDFERTMAPKKEFKPRTTERKDFKPRDGEKREFKPRSGEKREFKPKDGEKREFKPRDGGFKGKPASGRSGDFKPRRPGGRAR